MAAGGQTKVQSEELTFGRLLKTLRTEKGLELQAISDETKIAVSTLRLLEAEAYDKLPDTVFVKGFLKAYAGVLETSPDRLIQCFLAGRHQYNENLRYEASLANAKRRFWPWLILAAVVLGAVLYAVLSDEKTPPTDPSPEKDVARVEAEASSDTAVFSEADLPPAATATESGYLLEINAVEETWLKIIVDRQDPREYNLNPGDRLELKAASGFNLLIGNATGINLQLNHQPIVIEGKQGQVVTRKLP